MAYDISATGFTVTIKASVTFPQGFQITAWASDADPWDSPALDIATAEMNINGNLVTFSSPKPLLRNLNVIPGSDDDINLAILAEANRVGLGKRSARDIVTVVASWPDGSTESLGGGKMLNAMIGKSVASAARVKSKAYGFAFETYSATRPTIAALQ